MTRPCASVLVAIVAVLAACGSSGGRNNATPRPSSTKPAVSLPGRVFEDPQHDYTMRIAPGWSDQSGLFVEEVEGWAVAPRADGFTANVNVLTQKTKTLDLQQYLDLSVRNAARALKGWKLVRSSVVRGSVGNELGRFEYLATVQDHDVHFVAVITVAKGHAIVATLSTSSAAFPALSRAVEPYLLTLAPT